MIKAVTFDCWDTVLVDDHGCESRQQKHLLTLLQKNGFQLSPAELTEAFLRENKLREDHVVEHKRTKNARQRLETVLELLEVSLPLSDLALVADYFDKVALEFLPPAVPRVKEALTTLTQYFQLAVICNTGWHSAATIKKMLSGHDLVKYFDCFSFSDEIGVAKPHPRIFGVTLDRLGCSAEEAVHIGDAEYSDIVGAKESNMRAILFTGISDKYRDNNTADFVIDDYDDLPSLLNIIQGRKLFLNPKKNDS